MPLFGNTFNPRQTPPRKNASKSGLYSLKRIAREKELGLKSSAPAMNIGGQRWKFKNGKWIKELGDPELERLKEQNRKLAKENNLLTVKTEILINMVTQITAKFHVIQNELDVIKKKLQVKKAMKDKRLN